MLQPDHKHWKCYIYKRGVAADHFVQHWCVDIKKTLIGIALHICIHKCMFTNIDLVQRVQNHAARLMMGDFDYINSRGIDLVKSLNLYLIREMRNYFLLTFIFKAIRGIAKNNHSIELICTLISMVMIPGKVVQWTFVFQLCTKRYTEIFFLYLGGKLWNDLPDFVKNSTNIETFKRNYRIYKSITYHVSLHIYISIVLIRRIAWH